MPDSAQQRRRSCTRVLTSPHPYEVTGRLEPTATPARCSPTTVSAEDLILLDALAAYTLERDSPYSSSGLEAFLEEAGSEIESPRANLQPRQQHSPAPASEIDRAGAAGNPQSNCDTHEPPTRPLECVPPRPSGGMPPPTAV